MIKKSLIAILIVLVISLVFVSGFNGCKQQPTAVCNKPYILVGTDCCLDQNDNGICDSDETPKIYYNPSDIESARQVCSSFCANNDANSFCVYKFSIRRQGSTETGAFYCDSDLINGKEEDSCKAAGFNDKLDCPYYRIK